MLAGLYSSKGNSNSKFEDKRLKRAHAHVEKLWFPVNQELVEKIRTGLDDGSYDLDLGFLVDELKTDFSLFTFCLRELTKTLKVEGMPSVGRTNVREIFQRAGIKRIKKVLGEGLKSASVHQLEQMSATQAARLKEAMLSASTAEILSAHDGADPDIGYCSGLLRQLGLTLIAWNYPTMFERILSSLEPGKSLESSLNEQLGFSPSTLALSLVRDWGLGADLRAALGEHDTGENNPQQAELERIGDAASKLCEVGEALARANNPEHYPEAAADWKRARTVIESKLGSQGLNIIQEKVREKCENYLKIRPDAFEDVKVLDPEAKIQAVAQQDLLESNPHIKGCPPVLRKRLTDFYTELATGSNSRDNVSVLVKEIIPLAGFQAGCIYTVDPSSMILIPRTRIGRTQFIPSGPRPLGSVGAEVDTIVNAYRCQTPITHEVSPGDGKALGSYIAACLGTRIKAGVLYLEVPPVLVNEEHTDPLIRFKAVKQALQDCLKI